MKYLVPIGLGILGVWALTKYAKGSALTRLKLSIFGADLAGSLSNPEVNVNVLAQNPTNEDIRVTAMVADVYVNDNFVGNVSNFVAFVIQPATETAFPLKVRLNVPGLFSQIADILKGTGGLQAKIRVLGTLNVEGTIVPIDLTHKII